jgi:hypothetical protein
MNYKVPRRSAYKYAARKSSATVDFCLFIAAVGYALAVVGLCVR